MPYADHQHYELVSGATPLLTPPHIPLASPHTPSHPLRYEAASDLSLTSNLFVDELSARGLLMGMGTADRDTTRCPLRSAVTD